MYGIGIQNRLGCSPHPPKSTPALRHTDPTLSDGHRSQRLQPCCITRRLDPTQVLPRRTGGGFSQPRCIVARAEGAGVVVCTPAPALPITLQSQPRCTNARAGGTSLAVYARRPQPSPKACSRSIALQQLALGRRRARLIVSASVTCVWRRAWIVRVGRQHACTVNHRLRHVGYMLLACCACQATRTACLCSHEQGVI